MDSFIFIDKGPGKKKLHHTVMALYVLDLNDSDEDSTVDYETLIILNLKKKKYWKKERQRFAIRK